MVTSPAEKKGRILRIKEGYNPNSSSIGSVVFALPVALLGVTIGFGVLSAIIAARFLKKSVPGERANPGKASEKHETRK